MHKYATLLFLLNTTVGLGQTLPPQPVPVLPPQPVPSPTQPPAALGAPVPVMPAPVVTPPPTALQPPPQQWDWLGWFDESQIPPPLLPPPGWFAELDFTLLNAHVSGTTFGLNLLPGVGLFTVGLPNADLDVVSAPKILLGYRFGQGSEVIASYRSVAGDGRQTMPIFDPASADLRSRLDMNIVDVGYVYRDFFGPYWQFSWGVGGRVLSSYADSLAQGIWLDQKFSRHFIGGGVYANAMIARRILPNWDIFGSAEYSVLPGRVTLRTSTAVFDFAAPGPSGFSNASGNVTAQSLAAQLGASVSLDEANTRRLKIGYTFEQFWNTGKLGLSQGNVSLNGVFFRYEFNY